MARAEVGIENVDAFVADRRAAMVAGRLAWERVQIEVDGQSVGLDLLRDGERWLAVGAVADADLVLDGGRMPPEGLRLVRIADPAAHISP